MSTKRILLVDDDLDDQQLFIEALGNMLPPYKCDIAHDGREALIKAGIPPPYDIIFLDLNMPVMNGYECLTRLKNNVHLKNIPVVILSTSSNIYDTDRCKALGATTYLSKPGSVKELVKGLNDILNDGIN